VLYWKTQKEKLKKLILSKLQTKQVWNYNEFLGDIYWDNENIFKKTTIKDLLDYCAIKKLIDIENNNIIVNVKLVNLETNKIREQEEAVAGKGFDDVMTYSQNKSH
jgi:hypothetical protein